MGTAIDTIQGTASNPGATLTTITLASGDSANIRSFTPSSSAFMAFISRQGATAGAVRIFSPRLHDAAKGITIFPGETPTSTNVFPPQVKQPVYSLDALTIQVSGGTAETDAVALGFYYNDLPGVAAILKQIADIGPLGVNFKSVEVDITQGSTAFAWVDTKINTTEDLLKANKWYAVLGYDTDTAALALGVKGPETGNLRVCGPGPTLTFSTSDYFARMDIYRPEPFVPVFNSNNRNGFFVSSSQVATGGTTKVSLYVLELPDNYQP